MLVLSYPIKNNALVAAGRLICQLIYRILVAILLVLPATAAFSQTPTIVRTINPTGGLAGGNDLKIAIYSDGSYAVHRNGKSETYGITYDNPVQGINTKVRLSDNFLETPWVVRFGIDSIPNTLYISPISGTGLSGSPWKIQVMGQMMDFTGRPFLLSYTISYEKANSYFFLDYLMHFNSASYISNTANLYITEAVVMGANSPGTAIEWTNNSSCMNGFASGPQTTIGMLRTPALSCTPLPAQTQRSHVFINKTTTGFTTIHAGNASKRNNLYEELGAGFLSGDMMGSGGEQGMAGHRALGVFTSVRNIKTARFLIGYGAIATEFDAVANVANPVFETDTAKTLTVGFENITASGAEGDNTHPILGLNLKVGVAGRFRTEQYVRVKLIPDGSITNPATEHVDFEYEDFAIPAGNYAVGAIIPLTSVKIIGNTQLQYNRKMKFELASCNTLVSVGGNLQCTYEIIDDEDRRITISPQHKNVHEGQDTLITVHLPPSVTPSMPISVQLSVLPTSTINTPAYQLALPSDSTVVIAASSNGASPFKLTVPANKILERNKVLKLHAVATVYGQVVTADTTINIIDSTRLDPANTIIKTTSVPDQFNEGTTGVVTLSLPAGITTSVPIPINLVTTGSTATVGDDYVAFPTTIQIDSTKSAVSFNVDVKADNLVEKTEILKLDATANDGFTAFTVEGKSIDILDSNDPANIPLKFSFSQNPLTPGGAGAIVTVSLPSPLIAGYDIPVDVAKGKSSTVADDKHTTFLDGPFTILKNTSSITIPGVIEAFAGDAQDKTLVFVSSSTGFKKDSATLPIINVDWNNPANKAIELEIVSNPFNEGTQSDLKVGFSNTVAWTSDIIIQLNTTGSTANQPADYSFGSTTIKLPAGKRDTVYTNFFTAVSDRVFNKRRNILLNGTTTSPGGFSIYPATRDITDTTVLNTANKNISVATSSTEMIEGTTYDVTFSLPAGVSTDTTIQINVIPAAGSDLTAADYTISPLPVLKDGANTVTVQITVKDDGVFTGPATRTLNLTGESTDLPGLVFGVAAITVKDKDYVPNMAFDVVVTPTNKEIVEGASTGAAITLSLPGSLKAGYPIDITISKGLSSGADDSRHTGVPGTYTIAKDASSVTLPVIKANADNILYNDASLLVVAEATGFKKDSVSLLIKDATASDATNKALTLTVVSTPIQEGHKSDLKISFDKNITSTTDISIALSRNAINSTANTPGDYTLDYTTVKLPAGQRDTVLVDFITATSDRIFKPVKTLQLDGTATGYTITAGSATIEDTTSLNAANKNLSIATSSAEMIEGTTYDVTFSLPAGVSTDTPIHINVIPAAGSDLAATDYTISPAAILKGGVNTITVQITVKDDGVLTGPATRTLNLTGESTDLPGLVFGVAAITVKDKDYVPNMAFEVTVDPTTKEIVEGASTGAAITLALPGSLKAGYPIDITISKGLSSSADDSRHTVVPGTYTIAKDASSVTLPVIKANADNILYNDASLLVVAEATGFKKDSVSLLIKDATASDATNKALTLTVVSTPIQEGHKSDLKISFDKNITSTTDISIAVSRNAINSTANTPGDYTLDYTTVKLPAGQRDTLLVDFITATSDRIFKPVKTLQLDGTATGYTITAGSATIEDTTSLNAANKNISIATSSAEMIEGNTYDVTFKLPSGVSTDIPLHINVIPASGSDLTTADYTISSSPVLRDGANSITVQITIKDDGVLTGPATRILNLTGSSTDLPGLVFGVAAITVKDKDYAPNMALDITVTPANKEIESGAATGAIIKLTLPGGLTAGYDIPVVITKGLSSSAADPRHTIIPGTYIIEKNKQSVTLSEIKALGNNVLAKDELLVVVVNASNFKKDSVALTIKNVTAGKIALTGVTTGNSVTEGMSYKVRASLTGGIVLTQPVHVKINSSVLSVARANKFDIIPAEFDITPALGYYEFEVKANTNNIIDGRQLLRLTGTTTNFPGIVLDSLDIYIDDATGSIPGNLKLTMRIDSSILHKGSESKVTIGFENPLITSTEEILINVVRDAVSTLDAAGYELIPVNISLPAGKSETTFKLRLKTDNAPKGNETLQLSATAVPAMFTISKPGLVNIPGEGTMSVVLEKTVDAAEPVTNGSFNVKLAGNKVAVQAVKVTLLITGATGLTNITPVQTDVVIPVGKNSVAVPVNIVDNYIIEGDKTITIAVKAAHMTVQGIDYPLDFNVQEVIHLVVLDDESSADPVKVAQRKIKIEKLDNAKEPNIAGAFLLKFSDDRITAVKDVRVDYSVSGTATPGVDYQFLPGNHTIPAGKNSITIEVIPQKDELIEGDETVLLKLDKATGDIPPVIWEFEAPGEAQLTIVDDPVDNSPVSIHVRSDMSPNDDGVGNDFLVIEHIDKYPKNDVVVFNRWGGTVFKMSGYDNKSRVFKGRSNTGMNVGGDVPDGSYFYIVNITDRNGKQHRFTGFIVIKR
jgi:hypothetical protein